MEALPKMNEKEVQDKAWLSTLNWLESSKYQFNEHEMIAIQNFVANEQLKLALYSLGGGSASFGSKFLFNYSQ